MNQIAVRSRALLLFLAAAPLYCQTPAGPEGIDPKTGKDGAIQWFPISATRAQFQEKWGRPRMAGEFGDFVSLQYQIGVVDNHEYSHLVVFRKSDGALVSLTRNYEPERLVDEFFPAASETTVHYYPSASKPEFGVRLRRLPDGCVLMAIGSPRRGVPTGQLVLMRENELAHFYPWLKDQLAAAKSGDHRRP